MPLFRLQYRIFPVLLFFFCAIYHQSIAQEFGGNPSSIKWYQINTDTTRIIFPKGQEEQAERIASVIHQLQQNKTNLLGNSLKKIDIVLQNYTTISNGYVGLGPYRSEFYLTYPQNPFELGSLNWGDNLSLHEWRHVQQYSNFNKGLARVASVLFGQDGQALLNDAAIPNWFFEGDAVFNETRLSDGGRGRLPYFFSGFKSITQNKLHYNYMQLRNGSFKNYIPNHYNLGYLLVLYGYITYGEDFWKKVTADAATYKPLLYPFQGAVEKHAGLSFNEFVKNAFTYYEERWLNEREYNYQYITPLKKKDVVNYQHPYVTEKGDIIVVKNSNKKIPAFYLIDTTANEKKIAIKDISIDEYYSYNNGKIIYSTYKPDARWANKEFSQIKILDVATGKEKSIKHKARYFSPDISHDGKQITAVEIIPDDKYGKQSKLIIMNSDGSNKRMFEMSGELFSYPKFSDDDSFVYVIARSLDGEVSKILQVRDSIHIMTKIYGAIGYLQVRKDSILFTATEMIDDNLRCLNTITQEKSRIASIGTGLYKADKLNDSIYVAATPTAYGFKIVKLRKQNVGLRLPGSSKKLLYSDITGDYFTQTYNLTFLDQVADSQFTITKYRKSFKPFNFHSWRPNYDRPEWTFTIYGENILNTFQNELQYTYNENESSHEAKYSVIYGGSYIQPYLSVSETFNRTGTYNNQPVHWNEFIVSPGLQLPLNFSGGKLYRFMRLYSSYNFQKVQWTGEAKNIFQNSSFQYLNSGISYVWQKQKALQQIFPSLGQSILLQYKTAVVNYTAHQFLGSTSIFLPGLSNNHSFVINAAYQARDTANDYSYSNNFPFSRGYDAVDYPRMWKLGANYHLPLLYPDWGFANIVYFLRARANVFYDHTVAKSLRTGNTFPFRTIGTEIMFDTKWWNQHPISFGFRYNHLLDDGVNNKANANVWEFILPVLFN